VCGGGKITVVTSQPQATAPWLLLAFYVEIVPYRQPHLLRRLLTLTKCVVFVIPTMKHGVVFFYWSLSGGLQALHWANEGYQEECIGSSGGILDGDVRSLIFSTSGMLFAVGEGIWLIDPFSGSSMRVPSPTSFRAALWDRPAGTVVSPSYSSSSSTAHFREDEYAEKAKTILLLGRPSGK